MYVKKIHQFLLSIKKRRTQKKIVFLPHGVVCCLCHLYNVSGAVSSIDSTKAGT